MTTDLDYDFTMEVQCSVNAVRDSWNLVTVDNKSFLIDCERGHHYDQLFKKNHRPFFKANPAQFFTSHYPECISPNTTLLSDDATDVSLEVWQRMAFRVPIYDTFGLSGEDFFTEQQYFKVKPGQLETLTFTYSSKYVDQIQYKVEINKIISEAQSGCHRYQAVSVEKGMVVLLLQKLFFSSDQSLP